MSRRLTVHQFFARFPDEGACLNHIMEVRYGMRHTCRACGVEATFHKMSQRRAFACSQCGNHLYPMAKCDVFEALRGHVEIDESYVGGHTPGKPGATPGAKTIVLGMKERGGRTVAQVIPNTKMRTIKPAVLETIEPGATISTDELMSYGLLTGYGYKHDTVKHRAKEYVRGDVHVNSIESFWKLFKHSVRGTHIHISPKHMEKYLNEFTFRSNHRSKENAMFDLLVASF